MYSHFLIFMFYYKIINLYLIFLSIFTSQNPKISSFHMVSSIGAWCFLSIEWFKASGYINHTKAFQVKYLFLFFFFFFLKSVESIWNVCFAFFWNWNDGGADRKERCKGNVVYASLFGVGAHEDLVIGVWLCWFLVLKVLLRWDVCVKFKISGLTFKGLLNS